ncbi:MAG: prenyltransferase/squalene oxidase repeat-containing protein [Chloroflexota bacterium]|nr:prenyltransferase/squalene oxidase repeat-containing protein [Chloroflexota bacterium]
MITKSLRAIMTLLLAMFLASMSSSCAMIAVEKEASEALNWLRSQQQADGSIPSTVSGAYNGTSKAVLAIAAGNQDPHTWLSGDNKSPLDFLTSQAITRTDTITETGTAAWLTLAVVAAGEDPQNFGGVDLVQQLQDDYNSTTGQYGLEGDVLAQALSTMAVRATGQTVSMTATELVKSWQDPGGGWGYAYPCTGRCSPDVGNTALAMQALISAGEPVTSTAIVSATNFLKSQQGEDGGFQSWGTSNANSTAWGIQALIAAGQDPAGPAWKKNGHTPMEYLLSLQADEGYFEYSSPPPDWAADLVLTTVQAVPALAGKPFPLPKPSK